MRRVSLEQLTSDMVLAKSIYDNGKLILPAGKTNLLEYKDRLLGYEIYSLYVEDELSDGIMIPDRVKEETRTKCKTILKKCFTTLVEQGGLENDELDEVVVSIMNDLVVSEDTIMSMYDIGTKDDYTLIHSINSAVYSLIIGKNFGLKESELKDLAKGALLHDIGKVLISSDILLKNGKLTNDEFADMKKHTILGYEALCKFENLSDSVKVISLQHHERLDGSGYPNALKEDDIHLYAKIVAVADVYDALTSERCYRRIMSNYKAYDILKSDAGVKFDMKIFESLLQSIAIYPNGIIVKLSDGTHGIVKRQNPGMRFRPLIRVIDDRDRQNIKLFDLDLSKNMEISIVD